MKGIRQSALMKLNTSIMKCSVVVLFAILASASAGRIDLDHNPEYKHPYQYDSEDVLKTSASEYPVHGYHVHESDYYPGSYSGYRAGIGAGGLGGGGLIGGQYGGGFYPGRYIGKPFIGSGFGGAGFGAGGIGLGGGGIGIGGAGFGGGAAFYPHGGIGGQFINKNVYADENKKAGGESFEKAHGSKGASGQHGTEGFSEGQVALKDVKGDSGYYKDQAGEKKVFDDGKSYHGGQHFSQAGENGQGENQKSTHKKGHVTKGFKTSHHKDESGKTETFYDEAHDEGDKFIRNGNQGSYGNNAESAYKGGHQNGQFIADEKSRQGHYDKHDIVDKADANKGQYGQKGYHGHGEAYGVNHDAGQQSILGRQEANRLYLNHHPHGYVPFNQDY